MPDTITRDEAFRKLAARCSAKECCVAEVREKLHNWNIPRKEEDSIVEQLLKENYIDEARYCRAYAQDQFRFSGWGRIKIGYTLKYPDSQFILRIPSHLFRQWFMILRPCLQ